MVVFGGAGERIAGQSASAGIGACRVVDRASNAWESESFEAWLEEGKGDNRKEKLEIWVSRLHCHPFTAFLESVEQDQ